MRITIEQADQPFIHSFFGEKIDSIEADSAQANQLRQALQVARQQVNLEAELNWKRGTMFLVLFIFLYAALGASLTLDLSTKDTSHKSIAYALKAVPVLIAFSGFFLSLLFLFFTRSSARRAQNWERSILLCEKYTGNNLSQQINIMGARTTHYSFSAIIISLALFISLTWVVMYNFFTFTTSGVIGSVISLFITTMTYVILDIQLLKSGKQSEIDEPLIPADDDKEQP